MEVQVGYRLEELPHVLAGEGQGQWGTPVLVVGHKAPAVNEFADHVAAMWFG